MKNGKERGAVLIVSLIMLAVVTFIVIAYLAFAQRERTSVNMALIHTETRLILDMGTAVSQAVVARKVQDFENYQLIVSKNTDGASQKLPAYGEVSLKSLRLDARAPVYYDNDGDDVYDEFRFSLDLNRDGRHTLHRPSDGVGDPHWIGVLEDPSRPHGPDNQFVGRYAYMIVPASKTLDFNHIHNANKGLGGEGYLRTVGWSHQDLNLAGTLRAVGPDWPYAYQPNPGSPSNGNAFGDAASILQHRATAGNIYDIFDLYHPHRGSLKPLPPQAGHSGLTARLEEAGGYSFYDLAGSISTVTQPPPTGKVDLNVFINPRVGVFEKNGGGFQKGVYIGTDALQGSIQLAASHGMTNGARVNLFSDSTKAPFIKSDPRFPDGRRVSPYDRFYVKTNPDNDAIVQLYHEFSYSEDISHAHDRFSVPVIFSHPGEFPTWAGTNPISMEPVHYARNDIVFSTRIPTKEGGLAQGYLIARQNHEALPNLASYTRKDNLLQDAAGVIHWEVNPALPVGTYWLDRTAEMYEIVLARLLKASPGTATEMVRMKNDGVHADFHIHAYADTRSGAVDPNDPFAGIFGGGGFNNPFAGGLFNWPLKPKAPDVKYTAEARRLMQVAANICDIYTPGAFPSTFRPIFEKDEKSDAWMIRQFAHEPDSSFLARYPARGKPSELKFNTPLAPGFSYQRLGRLDFVGIPRAMPLPMGVKQAWDNDGQSLPPMINEISLIPHLHYDFKNNRIVPKLRMYVETRNPSGQDSGLELHILRAKATSSTRVSHSQQGLSVQHPKGRAVGLFPKIDFVSARQLGNAQPQTIPLANSAHAVNVYESAVKSGNNGADLELAMSDRADWNLSGYLSLEVAIVAPQGFGRHGKLVDHANLLLYFRSGDGITIPSWQPALKYQVGDEVIHRVNTKKRYYCLAVHDSKSEDQVKGNFNQVTGLDPAKWASATWTPNTIYRKGQILYHEAGVNTRLYLVNTPFTAGNQPVNNAGNLLVYGGNAAETSYQVNDPLMNCQEMDYLDFFNGFAHRATTDTTPTPNQEYSQNLNTGVHSITPFNIGKPNNALLAWTSESNFKQGNDNRLEHVFMDPGVLSDQHWTFPKATKEAPLTNVGQLGFVHRGTPWQTVYLKSHGLEAYRQLISGNPDRVDMFWKEWTVTRSRRGEVDGGGVNRLNGQYFEGGRVFALDSASDTRFAGWSKTVPLNDHRLVEEFAALPPGNFMSAEDAARGLLSVNQMNRAAWAAAMCGVRISRNAQELRSGANSHIHPEDTNLGKLVGAINDHRAATRGSVMGGTKPFTRVTDILGVPELTSDSPYLPLLHTPTEWHYEAIPRQTLSLLRVEETPYFIAYVYSQALRPKDRKREGDEWLIWNYEVVGEAAARTVFRIEGAREWADFRENGLKNAISAILNNPGGLANFPPKQPKAPRVVIENYTPMTTR